MSQATPAYASFAPPSNRIPPPASPLLASTPPTISISLSRTYPLLLFLDHVLALLTWTSDDPWSSFLVVCAWVVATLYYEPILNYLAPLLPVVFVWGVRHWQHRVGEGVARRPGLDHMVHTLSNVASRTSLLVEPLTALAGTRGNGSNDSNDSNDSNTGQPDMARLAMIALSLAPFYGLVVARFVSPRTVTLLAGVFVLTYHSVYARVTRAVLWRSRTVRRALFCVSGQPGGTSRRRAGSTSATVPGLAARSGKVSASSILREPKNPALATKFVFVVYENQRRWLGVGWTPNLLSYERAPWTDEFLNPSNPPSSFELPGESSSGALAAPSNPSNPSNTSNTSPMGNLQWRWTDPTWKLDLTNDGALVVNFKQLKGNNSSSAEKEQDKEEEQEEAVAASTTNTQDAKERGDKAPRRRAKPASALVAEPGPNDGWIYYDNTWKKPATEDSFLKYTRRRRWVRTAELASGPGLVAGKQRVQDGPGEVKSRKSLRFEE